MPKPSTHTRPSGKTRRKRPAVPLEGRLGLSQAEAAACIGKSPSSLRRWAHMGIGPKAVRCGGRALVFPVAELKAWLESNAQDPADSVGR